SSGSYCSDSPVRTQSPASSPTRRSSDLHGGDIRKGQRVVVGIRLQVRFQPQEKGLRLLPAPPVQGVVESCQVCQRFVAQVVEEPDRKSTRLNSSHVSISYAVFCLKKKTQ